MGKITNPAEVYFKDGLWAWDPFTDSWRKLETTYGTHTLEVKISSSSEVHQDTPGDMNVGAHGWTGAAWQKLPMLWGFSERLATLVNGTAVGAGDASAIVGPVGAGDVYILQAASYYHNAGVNKVLQLYVANGDTYCFLKRNLAAVSGEYDFWQGEICLVEGDTIVAAAAAPGAGKLCYLRAWGYIMNVAE